MHKTIGRLSLYRRLLSGLMTNSVHNVYSHELAKMAGVTAAQVRRDMMSVGYSGSPTRGYDVRLLSDSIGDFLDSPEGQGVALIGIGNLGRAIMAYFTGRRPRLSIVAAFDTDPGKVNRVIHGCRCYHINEMAEVVRSANIGVAIITVPSAEAQNAAELLAAALAGDMKRAGVAAAILGQFRSQTAEPWPGVPYLDEHPFFAPQKRWVLEKIGIIDPTQIDDIGALGRMRVERTRRIFDRTDIGVVVSEAGAWGEYEDGILADFTRREIPSIVVFNKIDLAAPAAETVKMLNGRRIPFIETVASQGKGVFDLREVLIESVPDDFINAPSIVGDLVPPGELVVFVVPIDLEAPKGRLILPQVQAIRDILDCDSYCIVVKERELRDALDRLNRPPALVVTDSQGFLKVAGDTPDDVPLTSFSILFARYKGDLSEFVRGARAIENLHPGDRVLIAEACSHHPIGEDIGRVKIPRWLMQRMFQTRKPPNCFHHNDLRRVLGPSCSH
ncbi:MAG TPA: redox-sensing transcriptional repressor Rex [Planctomycetota bacterium]|nr:redox-sensing transcriptional repressor Rex [Planctomycetota bacterium]